jgi:hypothetical protein
LQESVALKVDEVTGSGVEGANPQGG